MPDDMQGYIDMVQSEEDKILFQECIRCYEAGALRAAYILIWLTCAESLKRKFRKAREFDNTAQRIYGDLERTEANRRSIDVKLLLSAKEYGILSDQEHENLSFIYGRRCVYSHPYDAAPSDAEFHAAVDVIIDLVLSKPLLLREGYLSREITLICERTDYLVDHEQSIYSYAEIIFRRSDPKCHVWFLKKLWERISEFVGDPDKHVIFRRIHFLSYKFISLSDSEIIQNLGVDIPGLLISNPEVVQIFANNTIFQQIGEHAQDIVISKLIQMSNSNIEFLRTLDELRNAGALNESQTQRLIRHIRSGTFSLNALASARVSPCSYIDEIIEHLQSRNWYIQNPAVKVVWNIGADGISTLPEEKQEILGNNILQSADGNAHESQSFLLNLSNAGDQTVWPTNFIAGLVNETIVNNDNIYRFKKNYNVAEFAFLSLIKVPLDERLSIIDRLITRLEQATPSPIEDLYDEYKDEYIHSIRNAIQRYPDELQCLEQLIPHIQNLQTTPDP